MSPLTKPQPLILPARKEALERIQQAIRCDRALSEGQLLRYYQTIPTPGEAHQYGIRVVKAVVNLSHHANKSIEVRFYTPYLWIARLMPPMLRHLAGVSEMRHILKVPPVKERWQTDSHRIHFREEPDAVWFSPRGPIAIEYDAGSYTTALLHRKTKTFSRRYVAQFWGAPTERKAASLRTKLSGLGLEPEYVLVAPWW